MLTVIIFNTELKLSLLLSLKLVTDPETLSKSTGWPKK